MCCRSEHPRYNFLKQKTYRVTLWAQTIKNWWRTDGRFHCWTLGKPGGVGGYPLPQEDLEKRQETRVWVGEGTALLWCMNCNCMNVVGETVEVKMGGCSWPVPSLGHRLGRSCIYIFIFSFHICSFYFWLQNKVLIVKISPSQVHDIYKST